MRNRNIVGYFRVAVNGKRYDVSYTRSEQGDALSALNDGKVPRLLISIDNKIVCYYDEGWKLLPVDAEAQKVKDIALDRLA